MAKNSADDEIGRVAKAMMAAGVAAYYTAGPHDTLERTLSRVFIAMREIEIAAFGSDHAAGRDEGVDGEESDRREVTWLM